MMYEDVVADFAKRTTANLRAIRQLHESNSGISVYEVTQLINSMLGLLVFPQQRYIDRVPKTSLDDLASQGWPVPQLVGDYPQVSDLQELVRMLRNAIAHFNLEFHQGVDGEIAGLTVWNTQPRTNKVTWKAKLSISDLEAITEKFVQLLLKRETYK